MITIPEVGSTYVCTGTLLAEGRDSDILTTVNGIHQSGRSHIDVLGLFIIHQTMGFFPRNVEAFFPKITAFKFYGTGIFEITNNHLSPFPNLTYLDLDLNLITALDSDLFSGIELMKVISLNANKLMYIGHDFLSNGTATITNLLMRNNICVHDAATTPGSAVDYLVLRLRANCQPSTSQIETSLQRHLNSQVQGLNKRVDAITQSNSEIVIKVQSLVDAVEKINSELGIKVQSLVDAVEKCCSEKDNLQQSLSKIEDYMKTNQNLVANLVNRLSERENYFRNCYCYKTTN